MNSSPEVSVIGRSSLDCLNTEASLVYAPDSATPGVAESPHTVGTHQHSQPGWKVTADLRAEVMAPADSFRQGRGAFSSAAAYGPISNRPGRYLEACSPEANLTRETHNLSIEARYLGLYQRPCNRMSIGDGNHKSRKRKRKRHAVTGPEETIAFAQPGTAPTSTTKS
jgi:hypothetical protein